jgi:toxin HigB-1
MIRSFSHKGVELFFNTGLKSGIQPKHANKLRLQLAVLDNATSVQDLSVPSWKLHALQGSLTGHFSIRVDENWRLTFRFVGVDVELVNYRDYH